MSFMMPLTHPEYLGFILTLIVQNLVYSFYKRQKQEVSNYWSMQQHNIYKSNLKNLDPKEHVKHDVLWDSQTNYSCEKPRW